MHAAVQAAERARRTTRVAALAALQLLAPLLAAGAIVAHALGEGASPAARARDRDAREWTALLAAAPVRRLRAALLVDARDCPATLEVVEWFARPELAGAVGSVTLVVRDGRDSLARYADALLTAPVHLAVVALPPALRLRAPGDGPRLVLVDPAGRVTWSGRIGATAADLASLRATAERVADHYLHTELAAMGETP